MDWIRRLLGPPPSVSSPADPAPGSTPRPLLHQFTSVENWLRAWVEFRRAEWEPEIRSSYDLEIGKPCMALAGSLGMDSIVTVDGEVWVQFGVHEDELDGWRPALPNERVALLVSAQRPFPELAVLLPIRPVEATDCPDCEGTGRVRGVGCWCSCCSARGWLVSGQDFSLEAHREPTRRSDVA